jgi:hypothetical protein
LRSLIPFAGDTAKLAKFGKYLDTLRFIATKAVGNAPIAKLAEPALTTIVRILDSTPGSGLPREMATQLERLRSAAHEALAAARRAVGKGGCFVAGTLVEIPLPRPTHHANSPIEASDTQWILLIGGSIFVGVGLTGLVRHELSLRRNRNKSLEDAIDEVIAQWFAAPAVSHP